MKPHMPKIEVAARSVTGKRKENQDRMSGLTTPLGQLYILADGMGGHKGGEIAAEMTVHGLHHHITTTKVSASIYEIISDAFKHTNKTVYDEAHSGDATIEGMGSTAVLVLIHGEIASVAHVGDSRAYLFRNNRLKQLTRDHTVVQRMVEAGMLKPEDAAHHPDSNIIERAIGNQPEVAVDIHDELILLDGDAILLCSDGLSGYASNQEIESILRHCTTVQEVPDKLIQLALEDKGSDDNITVQFIQYGTSKIFKAQQKKLAKANASIDEKKFSRLKLISLILAAGISAGFAFYFWDQKYSNITMDSIPPVGKQEVNLQQTEGIDNKKKDIPSTNNTEQDSDLNSARIIDDQKAEQDSSPLPSGAGISDNAAQ